MNTTFSGSTNYGAVSDDAAGNTEPPPQQSSVGIAEVRALTGFGSMARRCTMLLFRADPFGGTHELLPCGLLGGDLVKLFRKNKSKYYWYDFTVRGERYRGSTKETNETRAQKAAALKLAAAIKGSDPLDRKPPTLREYSRDFLEWVATGRLESDTRRYYRNGWRPGPSSELRHDFCRHRSPAVLARVFISEARMSTSTLVSDGLRLKSHGEASDHDPRGSLMRGRFSLLICFGS
jgi:hypothetical protein